MVQWLVVMCRRRVVVWCRVCVITSVSSVCAVQILRNMSSTLTNSSLFLCTITFELLKLLPTPASVKLFGMRRTGKVFGLTGCRLLLSWFCSRCDS